MNQLRASSASTSSADGLIYVDESDYSDDDWVLPFEQRGVVRIRADEKFSDFYEIFGTIGEGKFGTVYRCREISTGLELAAKRIAIKRDADRRNVEQEVAIMQKMRHPRIAQIYDAFATKKNDIILIMEVVEGGELFDRVADENYVLTELAVVMIICQLCEAIEYIHSQNIVHLDVKPENIMCVSQTGNRIKLIDFGLAQYYDANKDLLLMAGTPEFAAPEVIKFEPIDFRTDMWSVGVITYILLSGISPFLGENNAITYNNVTKGDWEFDQEAFSCISDQAKHFISNLIVYDKDKRMTAKDCLEHPWIVESRRIARANSMASLLSTPAIDTEKLRRYLHMRRWKKATLAIFAVQRMGWNWLSKRLRLAKCVTDMQIANREASEAVEKVLTQKTNQSLMKSAAALLATIDNTTGKPAGNSQRKVSSKTQPAAADEQTSPEKKKKRLKASTPLADTPTKVDTPIATPKPPTTTEPIASESTASKPTEAIKKSKIIVIESAPEPCKTIGKVSLVAKSLETKFAPVPVFVPTSAPSASKIANVRKAFVFNSNAQRDAVTSKTIPLPSKVKAIATGTTTQGLISIRNKWAAHFTATVKRPLAQSESAQATLIEVPGKPKTSAKDTVVAPETTNIQQGAVDSEPVKTVKVTKRPTVKIKKPDDSNAEKPASDTSAQSAGIVDTNSLTVSPKETPKSPTPAKKKAVLAKTTELKLRIAAVEAKSDATAITVSKSKEDLRETTETVAKVRKVAESDNSASADKVSLMPLATGLRAVGQRRKPSVANPSSAIVKLCAAVLGERQPRAPEKCGSDIDVDTSGDEQNKTPDAVCTSGPAAVASKTTRSSTSLSKAVGASAGTFATDPSSAGTKQMLAVPKPAIRSNSYTSTVAGTVPSPGPPKTAKSSDDLIADENNRLTGAVTVDRTAKPSQALSTSKSTTKRLIVPKDDSKTDELSEQTCSPAPKPAKNTDRSGCTSTAPPANVSGDKQILVGADKSDSKHETQKKPAAKPSEARKRDVPTKEGANPDQPPTSSSISTAKSTSPAVTKKSLSQDISAPAPEAQNNETPSQKQEQRLSKDAKVTAGDIPAPKKKTAVRTMSKTEAASATDSPSKKRCSDTKSLEAGQVESVIETPQDVVKTTTNSSGKSVIKRKVQPSPKTASKSLSGETIVPKKIVCDDERKDVEASVEECASSASKPPAAPSTTDVVNEQSIPSEATDFKWAKSILESRLSNDNITAPEKKPVPRKKPDQTGNALRALQTWKNRDQQVAASKQTESPRLAVSAI